MHIERERTDTEVKDMLIKSNLVCFFYEGTN